MTTVNTVSLEFLRPGPAHNQLLSRLTPYCAVVDDRDATTLYLPFEHRHFLAMFRALCRGRGRDPQTNVLADALGQIVGSMPTFLSALASSAHERADLTHVRLILSASELALLPFELSTAPSGFPSAGQALFRQIQQPLSLTREVRGARVGRYDWTRPPRILVVSADAVDMPRVPLQAHLLALYQALSRWRTLPHQVRPPGTDIDHLIHVLPNATLSAVRDACRDGDFTHVHVLAHGLTKSVDGEDRFGIALCSRTGGTEIVSGEDLASALRTQRNDGKLSSPLWVTLCTCDSGRQGSVILPGGSMAHALQEAGIGWVLASQFPLSMRASVQLTQELYPGLLCGRDPRLLVSRLRRSLHSDCPHTYDWASLALYAALTPDFDDQLRCTLRLRVHSAVGVVFHQAEALLPAEPISEADALEGAASRAAISDQAERRSTTRAKVDELNREIERCRQELRDAMPVDNPATAIDDPRGLRERGEVLGLLASLERNRAFLMCQPSASDRQATTGSAGPSQALRDALQRAQGLYLQAAQADLSSLWCAVHYLSISAVLNRMHEDLPRRWMNLALAQAELYRHDETVDQGVPRSIRGWLALCELSLLRLLEPRSAIAATTASSTDASAPISEPAPEAEEALLHAQALIIAAREFPKEIERLVRRLKRYTHSGWWDPAVNRNRFTPALDRVLALFARDRIGR